MEDLAHDVWLSVIRRAEAYHPSAAFRTYLYRIAWNRLLDHWRKHPNEFSAHQSDESTHSPTEDDWCQSESSLVMDEIRSAIGKLPMDQRTAFLLKEEGFSQKEIADITDTKPETVKSRLRYANQALRKFIEAMV